MEEKQRDVNTTSFGLSEEDERWIEESLSERKGSSVEGKVVWLPEKNITVDDFPEEKEEVAFHLAIMLDDESNLAWYKKLAKERRRDFLKNCLKLTMTAFEKGSIKKTKAAYFVGVVKGKTIQQERLEAYKKKHTTLYGYGTKSHEK